MNFKVFGKISNVEVIAVGAKIRILPFLSKEFGTGRWRKLKGSAQVELSNGEMRLAEVDWFEAHGIGRKLLRIKRFLD